MTFTHTHIQTWTLSATTGRVFHALTDPTEPTQWFAESTTVEPRVGGISLLGAPHIGHPATGRGATDHLAI